MDDQHPSVSVIVAAYNATPTLRNTVATIRAQSVRAIEIIIADDLSTDGTVALAESLQADDPRIRIVRCARNGGPGAARNAALDASRGDWIAVVDADDEILPERFEKMIAAGEQNDADIVFDNLFYVREGSADQSVLYLSADLNVAGPFTLEKLLRSHLYDRPTPNLGFLKPMIRRAVLERLALRYDPALRIGEDAMLIATLLALGARGWLLPEAYYRYYRRAGSVSARLDTGSIESVNIFYAAFLERFAATLSPHEAAIMRTMIRENEYRLTARRLADGLTRFKFLPFATFLLREPAARRIVIREVGSRIKQRPKKALTPEKRRAFDLHGAGGGKAGGVVARHAVKPFEA